MKRGPRSVAECGEGVPVPSLSKLRATAGIGSYESGAIDTIRRMLDEGALPWGETCAVSGRPTRDVIQVEVQCERLHVPKDPARFALLLAHVASALVGRDLARDPRKWSDPRPGYRRVVPLRVGREFHRGLSRWWTKRKLRRLLRTVPVYARLLDEYPRATIARGRDIGRVRRSRLLIARPIRLRTRRSAAGVPACHSVRYHGTLTTMTRRRPLKRR